MGGPNGLGVDQGFEEEILSKDGKSSYATYNRAFSTTFNLMITSDSQTETLIIFHTLKAFLVSIMDTLELSGLHDVKLSSGDLNFNEELAPPNTFIKYIGINFYYDVSVKRWFSDIIINNIVSNGQAGQQ